MERLLPDAPPEASGIKATETSPLKVVGHARDLP